MKKEEDVSKWLNDNQKCVDWSTLCSTQIWCYVKLSQCDKFDVWIILFHLNFFYLLVAHFTTLFPLRRCNFLNKYSKGNVNFSSLEIYFAILVWYWNKCATRSVNINRNGAVAVAYLGDIYQCKHRHFGTNQSKFLVISIWRSECIQCWHQAHLKWFQQWFIAIPKISINIFRNAWNKCLMYFENSMRHAFLLR